MAKITKLMSSDFILVTPIGGGIGVAFEGTILLMLSQRSSAIAFLRLFRLEAQDMLKGSVQELLLHKKISFDVKDNIDLLKMKDQRISVNILKLEKVAQLLQGKVISKENKQLANDFIERMRKGQNFYNEDNEQEELKIDGEVLFETLKKAFDPKGQYLISMNQIELGDISSVTKKH